jgi:RNA polymerase sigma factor (sigma-70 family)
VPASEDVSQQVYLAAWQNLGRLRNPASFLPWLRELTRNAARQANRGERRRVRRAGAPVDDEMIAAVADPSPDVDTRIVAAEEREALSDAFDELPDETRELLTLYYREGRSVSQVASLLGLGEAAVKKRLERGRDALREAVRARFEQIVVRSAPSVAFSASVAAAIAVSAPSTAAAAGTAGAAGLGGGVGSLSSGWAKIAALAGPIALGLLGGLLGVFLGHALLARSLRDRAERSRLRTAAVLSAVAVTSFCLLFPFAISIRSGEMAIASYAVAVTGYVAVHMWRVRPVLRRFRAARQAGDPSARRRFFVEDVISLLIFGGGVIGGAVTLVIALRRAGLIP